ncbi:type VII secretion integral membrane protein EccD [Pseudonocardia xinjiangensis]|uniref:Type VII secretion integral membrane protein EccD n=1 Tax=Pseudonocardia xinjiangensis TaxID=75289 RepID=A0ABX1R6T3_9PSEU|nr:type VII secretion integral membrane protein EccD [Pseudonocardia xinjiangensis]NMH76097.1 type VII secretion integral membrane protein EccD [Pseudonocardia xinjiangensis]
MRAAAADAAYCRLTVLAPRARVDVALPADVPVAELVPMVLELVGEPVFGLRPVPWRLSGAAGGPLPAEASLGELGVLDGELLRLAPQGPAPVPPVFDDPVDALAATAATAAAGDRRFGAGVVLAVALAAAALLAGRPAAPGTPWTTWTAAVAALAAVAAVAHAARLARTVEAPAGASRVESLDGAARQQAASTAALAAVPLAAAAGWAALSAAGGAAQLLLATAAAGIAAALAQIALRVVAPVLVGIVVAAVPVGVAAVVVLRFGVAPAAAAAAVGAVALAVGPVLPRAALRLAGLPRPVVPADGAELVDADDGPDLLPPAELAERADLARGYLAGLVGGCAVLAAAAALPVAAAGGWAGPAFAAVSVAVLALRARSFADRAPARVLLGSAVTAGVGLAVLVATQVGPGARLGVAAVLLVAAAAGSLALGRTRPAGSPVSRRAVDLLEGLLVAASIPLALAAMDLFRLVRGL